MAIDRESYFRCVDETAAWLKGRVEQPPRAVVVLSAGLEGFLEGIERPMKIAAAEIPNFPRPRAEGHAGTITFGVMHGVPIAAMAGRFHFYEGHAPQDVIFPTFVMASLGAKVLVATNAAGGITRALKPGDLLMVTDHINLMGFNPLVGIAVQRNHDQFTDMTQAYDADLGAIARRVAKGIGLKLKEGVYLAVSGPSYETKSEIRAFRAMGADAVGMSTVPEVIAAKFLAMRVLCFSCIANAAADLHEGAISHSEVLAAMRALSPRAVALLSGVVKEMGANG